MARHLGAWTCAVAVLWACTACSDASPADAGTDQAAKDASTLEIGLNTKLDSGSGSQGDVGQDGEGAAVDGAGFCPGGAGCSCKENTDCQTGMCIENEDIEGGKACAKKCEGSCPTGYTCANVTGAGGDIFGICVPKHQHLCEPCAASKDCESIGFKDAACLVVAGGEFGRFCGAACSMAADCPAGYGCIEATSAEGTTSKQCVKNASGGKGNPGQCGCTSAAQKKKLSTSCWKLAKDADGTVLGKCPGVLTCGDGSAAECKTAAAAPEKCNGQDDDCDGQTDEAGCDDGNPCTQDLCAGQNGCTYQGLEGLGCDADGSVCTANDVCKAGLCIAGTALNCQDDNPCTADACDPKAGCQHASSNGVACDDGDPCTVGDVCQSSVCQVGKPKTCASNSPCVEASCLQTEGGACKFVSKKSGTPCDDGDICTDNDNCLDGTCAGVVGSCDDGNPCTADSCATGSGCLHKGTAAKCSDGNSCTLDDACAGGVCVAGALDSCADDNPCTADSCAANTGCKHLPAQANCDDGNACTLGDACKDGACTPSAEASCDDSNPCTLEACEPKFGCVYLAVSGACSDGDACTSGDACKGKTCQGGAALLCADGNDCTLDSCDSVKGCTFNPTSGPCSDAGACATGMCAAGQCSLPSKPCSDGNPCTADSCNQLTGKCIADPVPLQDKLCDADGSVCTAPDLCAAGKCAAGKQVDCNDDSPCTQDSCASIGGCSHKIVSGGCNDGNACTGNDTCTSGTCAGAAVTCSDNNACTSDSCEPASGCAYVASSGPCNDGAACTTSDACQGGKCIGVAVICDDKDACTSDSCDPLTGNCSSTPVTPSGSEVCGNGLDDNCNGATDENCNPWQLDSAAISYTAWAGSNTWDNSCGACTAAPNCPKGSVAVGYQGAYGAWIDHLQLTCQILNGDGSLGNMAAPTGWFGGSAGPNAFGPLSCPSGRALVRATLWAGDQLQGMAGYCLTPAEILAKTAPAAAQAVQGVYAGGGSAYDVACPPGAVVTGINGYAGEYPHKLQLQCTPMVKN